MGAPSWGFMPSSHTPRLVQKTGEGGQPAMGGKSLPGQMGGDKLCFKDQGRGDSKHRTSPLPSTTCTCLSLEQVSKDGNNGKAIFS